MPTTVGRRGLPFVQRAWTLDQLYDAVEHEHVVLLAHWHDFLDAKELLLHARQAENGDAALDQTEQNTIERADAHADVGLDGLHGIRAAMGLGAAVPTAGMDAAMPESVRMPEADLARDGVGEEDDGGWDEDAYGGTWEGRDEA